VHCASLTFFGASDVYIFPYTPADSWKRQSMPLLIETRKGLQATLQKPTISIQSNYQK
jgi:hypothetical protein